jgi:hypothetical protein
MALGDYRILPGLVTEEIGQEILVCDTDLAVVHRVSGPAADVLRQVLASGGAPAALQNDDVTSGLVAAGVLVAVDAPAELVSRRSFVGAAAAVGAFGIVTLALPRAAAASSSIEGAGGGGATPPPTSTGREGPFSFTVFSNDPTEVRLEWETIQGQPSFTYSYTITQVSNGDVLAASVTNVNSDTRVTAIQSIAKGITVLVVVTSDRGAQITLTQTT